MRAISPSASFIAACEKKVRGREKMLAHDVYDNKCDRVEYIKVTDDDLSCVVPSAAPKGQAMSRLLGSERTIAAECARRAASAILTVAC